MGNFRNYNDVLRVAKEYIKKDIITDNDIISLAGVLCNFILNDEHPQTAAGNVVNTFVDSLNTEEIRISCDHNTTQSNKMAERYVLLLNTIGKLLKFSFPVSVRTKEFIEAHNIYEPQHGVPEAPQQPIEGNDGSNNYIELPEILKISDKAQSVFTEAVAKGWMVVNNDGTAEWIGVTQPNKFGKVKAKWRQLAYMCGEIYGFKYDLVNEQYGNQGETVPWTDLQNFFGISDVVNLAHEYAGAMEARNRPPGWRTVIDNMISSISI